jgi:hypothetical protein
MTNRFRVLCKGRIAEGFEREQVIEAAIRRLKAPRAQIERLFSGKPSVLKKDLSKEQGERYVQELARIGLIVHLRPMPEETAQSAAHPFPDLGDNEALEAESDFPSLPANATVSFAQSADLEKTEVASADAIARYLQDDPAQAPTVIVPRTQVASRLQQAQAISDPASAPTLIVPRRPADTPTVIVTRPQVDAPKDAERTLIGNPDALESYFRGHESRGEASPAPAGEDMSARQPHRPRRPLMIDQAKAGKPVAPRQPMQLPEKPVEPPPPPPSTVEAYRGHLRILVLILIGVALAGFFVILNR